MTQDITGQPAEVRFTLEITRAATGAVERHEMVGYTRPPAAAAEKEAHHDDHPLDGSPERGD